MRKGKKEEGMGWETRKEAQEEIKTKQKKQAQKGMWKGKKEKGIT